MLTFNELLSGNFAQSISSGAFFLPITSGLKWFVSYSTTSTNNNGPQRKKEKKKATTVCPLKLSVSKENENRR